MCLIRLGQLLAFGSRWILPAQEAVHGFDRWRRLHWTPGCEWIWGPFLVSMMSFLAGWWFGTFFMFHKKWDNPSHWRTHIFQDCFLTTNKLSSPVQVTDSTNRRANAEWNWKFRESSGIPSVFWEKNCRQQRPKFDGQKMQERRVFGVFPPGNQFGSGLDSPIELLVSKNTHQQQTTKTYQNYCFKSFQSITGWKIGFEKSKWF